MHKNRYYIWSACSPTFCFVQRLHAIDSQDLHKLETTDPSSNLKYLELWHCENLRHLHISASNLDMIKLFISHSLIVVNIPAPILSCVSLGAYISLDNFWQKLRSQFSHVKLVFMLTSTLFLF